MTKVTVAAVTDRDDGAKHSVVTLLDEAGRRILNIWIMDRDALVIALGVTGTAPIRPMSMHLMVNLLKATGMELEEVRIETLKDDVFYAVTKIRNGNVSHELDARPSDAIALAVLMDKPIYVAEEVLERCGVVLPEGKTLHVDKVHGAMLKKVEEVSQWTPQTAEEREEAHRRLIAFLMGE